MKTGIVLHEEQELQLRQLLFDTPGVEGAAFLLCGQVVTHNVQKLVANAVVAIAPEDFIERSADGLILKSAAIAKVSKLARYEGLSVVFAHSHPGGFAAFSTRDDREEEKLIPFFQSRIPGHLHGTLVLTETTIVGRIYSDRRYEADQVLVIGQRFRNHARNNTEADGRYDRQVRAFGPSIQRTLNALTVGIVGVGGTGSACAEQLKRLGVGHLILFDHDSLEDTNLNRVYGATIADVGKNKAEVAATRLNTIGLDGVCEAVPESIVTLAAAKRLRECDVVFGCTDKEIPRAILSRLALTYHIPVIDMGVVIDSIGGVIRGIYGRVTTLIAKEPCLFCRGRISAEGLRVEALSAEDRERHVRQGYAPELDSPSPAVIAFTSMTASHAVSELLHRLTGFMGDSREASEVLLLVDKNRIGTNRRSADEACFCSVSGDWGRGDQTPYLDMVWPTTST
ncbi:ThiF family adenylyltransferase [Paraburkholderia acidicola]|uniref:ThiF family adenylyltransferase n=1 Tax=Paraburkholderia acidicola TaxID=1912599 RepID=A0ABV1LLM5_9BURK